MSTETQAEKVIEAAGNFMTEEDLLALGETELLGKGIAGNIDATPEAKRKRDEDIDQFIKKWKKMGISVSYHPAKIE